MFSPGNGSVSEEAVFRRLEMLQSELKDANERLDGNFDRLEAAGLTTCSVAQELASALAKAALLESELVAARAARNRASSKLEHTKCPDCEVRFDARAALQSPSVGESSML